MTKRMLVVLVAAVGLTAARTDATTPGPGQRFDCADSAADVCATDDTGCVPDSKDHLKCARKIEVGLGKALACIVKCHSQQATALYAVVGGRSTKPFDEDGCEADCKTKLESTMTSAGVCSSAQLQGASFAKDILFGDKDHPPSGEWLNGAVLCDSTSGAQIASYDPDDAGWIPSGHCAGGSRDLEKCNVTCANDADCDGVAGSCVESRCRCPGGFCAIGRAVLKCETAVEKNVAKLVANVLGCHQKLAEAFFRGKAIDDESCEDDALEKYDRKRDILLARPACPPCLDAFMQDSLASFMTFVTDALNVNVYPCPTTTTTTTLP